MKTIKLTKDEIVMLLDAINEWEYGQYHDDAPDGEQSGYNVKQLKAMNSAKQVLLGVLNL